MRKLIFLLLLLLIATPCFGQQQEARMSLGVIGGGVPATAASAPAWGGDLVRGATWDDTATYNTGVVGITVPQNSRIVIVVTNSAGTTQTVASVSDTKGNTYATDKSYLGSSNYLQTILSANVATALGATDYLTITFATPSLSYRFYTVVYLTGCATSSPVDQTASGGTYGTTVSAAAATTATNTIQFGILLDYDQGTTYGSSNWTVSAADPQSVVGGGMYAYHFYHVSSSAGSQDPGGVMSRNETWVVVWVAYK